MFERNRSQCHRTSAVWGRSLVWLATAPLLVAVTAVVEGDHPLWAQTPNPLADIELPVTLEPGSRLAIQSSEAMRQVNEALKSRFSSQYGNAAVAVDYASADDALQSLIDGDGDLAAIGRSLTATEVAAGLREVPVAREKIAIVVSPNNPFAGSLTVEQFAQIFRGDITNWSQLGGVDAPIVLVDHPETSDTRQAFPSYPVFRAGPFVPAPGAIALPTANITDIAAALDDNAIGYVVAEQALNNPAVKIVPMHDTLPDDQRYPFSQPLAYVYNPATATPATLAFLGFATNADSEALIAAARAAATAPPVAEATAPEATLDAAAPVAPAPAVPAQKMPWWPWLLALPVLGGLLWWLLKDRAPAAAPLAAAPARRIILTPRDCRSAYAYWELPEAEIEALKAYNNSLALKLHDVTDIADVDRQGPHSTQPFDCETVAVGDRHLPVTVDDRDYLVELGYSSPDGQWNALARSASVRVPACPSSVTPAAPGIGAAAAAAAGLGAVGLGAAAARPVEAGQPSRVILTPRDCQTAYAYWEISPPTVKDLQVGGRDLRARLYDVTELPGYSKGLNSLREFNVPLATLGDLHLPIAIDDRDYLVEIGYIDGNYQWRALAKSEPVRVPACTAAPAAAAAASTTANLTAAYPSAKQALDVIPPHLSESVLTADLTTGVATGESATVTGLGATAVALGAANGLQAEAAGVGRRIDRGAESKIILVPRSTGAAYVYWEVAAAHRELLREKGGRVMALHVHDATNVELDYQPAHVTQEYILRESDTDCHVPIPVPDRDYVAELGYLTASGEWLQLVRSLHMRVPVA
jgi:phosphate transport system substrate-binding protein